MSTSNSEKGAAQEWYETFFGRTWPMWVGGILLGIGNICLFLVKSPWGASGGVLNWGQHLFHMAKVKPLTQHPYAMLCILTLVGAFIAALLSREFAIRIPPGGELLKGFIGGILMGLGATIGKGCTIGGFFSGWAALSAGAIIFTIGLTIGAFLSLRYLLWEMEKFPRLSSGKTRTFLAGSGKGDLWKPWLGVIVLIIGFVIASAYNRDGNSVLAWFVLIGLFFGIVCQRSRFCIVRALREPFMTGESSAAMGVMAGILVGMFGFVIIKFMGIGGKMVWVFPHFWLRALIGGTIFGLGMTIAGGCVVGSLWRAGEGHVKLWASLLGMAIGLPLSAKFIVPGFLKALPTWAKQKVFLPDVVGYPGAAMIFVAIIFLWYLFVKWNERTGRFSAVG